MVGWYIFFYFQSMTRSNIEDYKQSYANAQKKVHVQTTLNFSLQKIALAVIKLMSQKW
jgi:hypothetical protein